MRLNFTIEVPKPSFNKSFLALDRFTFYARQVFNFNLFPKTSRNENKYELVSIRRHQTIYEANKNRISIIQSKNRINYSCSIRLSYHKHEHIEIEMNSTYGSAELFSLDIAKPRKK